MHIVCVNQFFWPDAAPTARLLEDLTRRLSADGHRVTVICAANHYRGARPERPAPPVEVRRILAPEFGRSRPLKALSYLWFLTAAAVIAFRVGPMDLLITMTTPPFIGLVGTAMRTVKGVRHFLWEMDLYPEIAVDLALIRRNSAAGRILAAIAGLIRGKADGVLVLGDCMRKRMLQAGVPPSKLHIVENWADHPHAAGGEPSQGLELEVLYSGNLGLAHDMETIGAVMLSVGRDPRFRFHFAGSGPRLNELRDMCLRGGVQNAVFSDYQPSEAYLRALSECHIGLVTQRASCAGSVVPSKVYAILAAGRPVLFIGPAEATPARIVAEHGCGWHFNCGDVEGVVRMLEVAARRPDLVRHAAQNARRAFENQYHAQTGVARVVSALGLGLPAFEDAR